VAPGCRSAATGEESEAISQPGRELFSAQELEPGGCQLDRQGDAVQLAADIDDERDVRLGQAEVGRGRGGAVDEEMDSLVLGPVFHIRR
jgi:hypothetical protein